MKQTKKYILVLAFVAFLVTLTGPVKAGNQFRNETTTAGGYSTWDSDMINIEQVEETGAGVYIAVLDTGLAPNWKDYFPEERIATEYGIGFYEQLKWDPGISDFVETTGELHTTTFIGSRGTCHGTHVTSTIIGYFYDANYDELSGFDIGPIIVRGIAPDVTIIPVKVLADYQVPRTYDEDGVLVPAQTVVFGTDRMVAAGIQYIADLAPSLDGPVIISMSLGGDYPDELSETAIDNAIANGVIVVASAGNEGEEGMGWPGAYPQVISVGATGWTEEWLWWIGEDPYFNRMWWLQHDEVPFYDISEPTPVDEVYVTDFSSREIPDHPLGVQQLDVLAPGSWVRGPYPGFPGYSHLPWWSEGIGDLAGLNPGNFYYVGGTSMSAPHVSAVAALILEIDDTIEQAEMEALLKGTALPIPAGSRSFVYNPNVGWTFPSWGSDANGAGLVQADAALAAVS